MINKKITLKVLVSVRYLIKKIISRPCKVNRNHTTIALNPPTVNSILQQKNDVTHKAAKTTVLPVCICNLKYFITRKMTHIRSKS